VHATTWTVSNNNSIPAQFSNLQTCFSDAGVVNGDTIYIMGSPNQYTHTNGGGLTLSKSLVLIGTTSVGHAGIGVETSLTQITVTSASTLSMIGINMTGRIYNTTTDTGLYLEKCKSDDYIRVGSNSIIKHCIFSNYLDLQFNGNILITNCLFSTGTTIVYQSNQATVQFTNNVVKSTATYVFDDIANMTIENNVFLQWSGKDFFYTSRNFKNNILRNNIFDNEVNQTQIIAGYNGLNTLTDNYTVTDADVFVDIVKYELKAPMLLLESSTGLNEIGMYGGGFPFPEYQYWGVPNIPLITDLRLINAVVAPGELLKVKIQATSTVGQ
jgi:hypothetical protein